MHLTVFFKRRVSSALFKEPEQSWVQYRGNREAVGKGVEITHAVQGQWTAEWGHHVFLFRYEILNPYLLFLCHKKQHTSIIRVIFRTLTELRAVHLCFYHRELITHSPLDRSGGSFLRQ